jgi:hypothetical protein
MIMKTCPLIRKFAFVIPLVLLGVSGLALAAEYEIGWQTIDGGGGASSGGPYTLVGTIGQPDTGVSSGGELVLSAGFWPGNFGCVVNLTDLKRLAEAWLGIGIHPADLDESGKVDMADFAVLSGWWMNHCPADWPLK